MFTALSERLTAALKRLTGRGVLSEQDVTEALREIRRHLLEADVSFEVTRGFVERVRERAVGALHVKAVSPGQQVVKLVHDEIATLLGGTQAGLDFASVGPTVIVLVGLQGSSRRRRGWSRRMCIDRPRRNSSSSSARRLASRFSANATRETS